MNSEEEISQYQYKLPSKPSFMDTFRVKKNRDTNQNPAQPLNDVQELEIPSLVYTQVQDFYVNKPVPLAILDIEKEQIYKFQEDSSVTVKSKSQKLNLTGDDAKFSNVKFKFLISYRETIPGSINKKFLKPVKTKSWQQGLPLEWNYTQQQEFLNHFKGNLEGMKSNSDVELFASKSFKYHIIVDHIQLRSWN